MNRPIKILIYLVFIILCAVSITEGCKRQNEAERVKNQVKALTQENKQYKNENGELVSENLALVGTVKELRAFSDYLQSKGDTLRTQFKPKTQELTYLKKVIKHHGSGTITPVDTFVTVGPATVDSAQILIDTADRYHAFRFASNHTRYAYEFQVFDNTELIKEDTRDGTLVRVINHNPYVIQSEAKSLLVEKKRTTFFKKAFWIGVGAVSSYLIFK